MEGKRIRRIIAYLQQSRTTLYYAAQNKQQQEAEKQRAIQKNIVRLLNKHGYGVVMTHFNVHVLRNTRDNHISNL